jgi:hypothetical protein
LKQIFRSSLNVFGDGVAVGWAGKQGAENEDVKRALEKLNAVHYVEILRLIM